jgi:hypothetical protein
VGGALRQRRRVHVRPEGFRKRPESDGESLLSRPEKRCYDFKNIFAEKFGKKLAF